MNRIFCIGEALIDMICTDKGMSLTDGENFLKKAGGAPMNVAAAIAALGGRVSVAAKVGADPFGKHLKEVLNSFSVDTSLIIEDPTYFTTFAFVSLMNNGERDFYFNRGADGQLSKDDIAGLDLSSFDIFHFGSATAFLGGPLNETYSIVLQKARATNRFVSFDPNYRHLLFGNNQKEFISRSWEFISTCDFFKISDEEAFLLTNTRDVHSAARIFLDKSNAVFAITLGAEGTLLGFQNEIITIPSIPVHPVDTTGAGDAFVGAVLYQLSEYPASELKSLDFQTWQHMVSQANKAGARTCEFMGAMEAFKFLNKEILRK
jgi:fructokinase